MRTFISTFIALRNTDSYYTTLTKVKPVVTAI